MKLLASAVIAGSVVGCAKIDSKDVTTKGITADISAVADGTGTTTVDATLYVGDPNNLDFVQVDGTDLLIASLGAIQQPMQQIELGNIVSYSTSFADTHDGDQFTVDFQRAAGDVSAPASFATPPTSFTLDTPPTMASRAQALTVTWTSADDPNPMQWNASGGCIDPASGAITTGASSLTIAANTFVQAGSASPTSCTVTVTVQRNAMGTLDPAFGGGGAVGIQQRSFQMTSNP